MSEFIRGSELTPKIREFSGDAALTKELQASSDIEAVRARAREILKYAPRNFPPIQINAGRRQGLMDFVVDAGNLVGGKQTLDVTIGSYKGTCTIRSSNSNDGTATLDFYIFNRMQFESLTRNPATGIPLAGNRGEGMFQTRTQEWRWSEPIFAPGNLPDPLGYRNP